MVRRRTCAVSNHGRGESGNDSSEPENTML
jgi:hypothetical protein